MKTKKRIKNFQMDLEEQVCHYLFIKFEVTYGQAIWHFNMCAFIFWDMMADQEPAHFIAEVIARRRKLKVRKHGRDSC